jgi:hypothetical protein
MAILRPGDEDLHYPDGTHRFTPPDGANHVRHVARLDEHLADHGVDKPPTDLDTDEYRAAVTHAACPGCRGAFSDSDHTQPMRDWHDKPHRLIYNLCDEVDRLRAVIKQGGGAPSVGSGHE